MATICKVMDILQDFYNEYGDIGFSIYDGISCGARHVELEVKRLSHTKELVCVLNILEHAPELKLVK